MTHITRCLIANRGEIAVRIIRACRASGIAAVAAYSDADAGALFVRLADRAVRIGGAPASESYLHIGALIDAARRADCDAIHPGYGFLSESAAFAAAVIDAGLTWIGAPPDAIAAMGDKIGARARMAAAGVPIPAAYSAALGDPIVYPVLVKAAAGGGGRGIRIAHDAAQLAAALDTAAREAQNAFGDARVFVEQYIERGRHIEVQIFGDHHGNIVHLGERECSAQRRHQKVIEESPSPLVDADMRARIGAAAVAAARAVGYVNAGTVEFIADARGAFYFLEMNTRLQVEHPVTEAVTGYDLVALQFAVASGAALPFRQDAVLPRGHAIEARLYAENPRLDFAPSPGTLRAFSVPHLPDVRVDAGFERGDSIPIHYDALIAKLIAYDATRAGAIRKLDAALRATVVLGVATNRDFLRALLAHPAFAAGEVDTTFIESHMGALVDDDATVDSGVMERALIAAALHDFHANDGGRVGDSARIDGGAWGAADGFRLGDG
jgi:3-methylcrotonyl-CoA carboxylase alpha subunit